jgi:acyl-CoA synthetase (AMP-forming)/AMP-acid ligase II
MSTPPSFHLPSSQSGGEKISALEIERSLLNLPSGIITDCAVLAVPDEKWGEVVSAVVVLSQADGEELAELKEKLTGEGGVKALRQMLRGQLAAYKLPQKLKIYEGGVPRNAMGKVSSSSSRFDLPSSLAVVWIRSWITDILNPLASLDVGQQKGAGEDGLPSMIV